MTFIMSSSIVVLVLLSIRIIEYLIFIKKVSKICNTYDWKYIDEHGYPLIEVLKDEHYYLKSEWSAYNFLFMKGPSPANMIFNLKPLSIKSQYNNKAIEKLKTYEVI
jgi:hypothetical protein